MTTSEQQIKDMRLDDGNLPAYAWPGGYPMFYLDSECSTLCPTCADAAIDDCVESFRPVAADVNYEDNSLYCDQCSERIESAYADDDR